VADGYAGVEFCVLLNGIWVPLPESGANIATWIRGPIRLDSMDDYLNLAALKSKVSVREIPWRATVVVDLVGPGIGDLTWLDTDYQAILANLSGPRTDAKTQTTVIVNAEFLIAS
jgi:hypothetical protein